MRYLAGIDVSRWNGLASTTGLDFAFARATYSTARDPKYAAHVAHFRAAGMVIGAYHFGTGASPAAQAKAFLAASKGADLLALDLERDPHSSMTNAQAKAFIAHVHAAGKTIGLYHSRSGFPRTLGQDWNWIAQWGAIPPSGLRWAFWQWQGHPLDRDKFKGDRAALLALAGT